MPTTDVSNGATTPRNERVTKNIIKMEAMKAKSIKRPISPCKKVTFSWVR